MYTVEELFDFSSFHCCFEVYFIRCDEFVASSHKLSKAFLGKSVTGFIRKTVIGAFSRFVKDCWSQSAITCSKLTIETLEQGVKYVQD